MNPDILDELSTGIQKFIKEHDIETENILALLQVLSMKYALEEGLSYEQYVNCLKHTLKRYKTMQEIRVLMGSLTQ